MEVAILRSISSFQEEQDFEAFANISFVPKAAISNNDFPNETNVRGDGNCLFRCIAIEMYGDEKYHNLVRERMIKFVSGRKPDFVRSANLSNPIDTWIGRMSNCGNEEFELPGEFGDAFAIELLSWMLERPIIVSIRDVFNNTLLYTDSTGVWFDKPTIRLVLRSQHYTLSM